MQGDCGQEPKPKSSPGMVLASGDRTFVHRAPCTPLLTLYTAPHALHAPTLYTAEGNDQNAPKGTGGGGYPMAVEGLTDNNCRSTGSSSRELRFAMSEHPQGCFAGLLWLHGPTSGLEDSCRPMRGLFNPQRITIRHFAVGTQADRIHTRGAACSNSRPPPPSRPPQSFRIRLFPF